MKGIINGQQQKRGGDGSIPAQIGVGLGTADIMATHRLPSPPWFQDMRFGPLAVASASSSENVGNEGAADGAPLTSRLAEASANKDHTTAASIITGALLMKIADILRIPSEEVDVSRAMYTYEVDSLVALEVRNWIARELKANMALLDILAAVPIEKFAGQIAEKSKLVTGTSVLLWRLRAIRIWTSRPLERNSMIQCER